MKTITVFVAEDGTRFDSVMQCRDYEKLCLDVTTAMIPLGSWPNIASQQYVQHTREACTAARIAMNRIVRQEFGSCAVFEQNPDDAIMPYSIAGRFASESSYPSVSRAYYRLNCINWETFREYQQPYYASHPNEATEQMEPKE